MTVTTGCNPGASMIESKGPPCGLADCTERATHVDSSGVGYCTWHGEEEEAVPVGAGHPFDPWWAASSLGREGPNAAAWEGLEYGEYPPSVDSDPLPTGVIEAVPVDFPVGFKTPAPEPPPADTVDPVAAARAWVATNFQAPGAVHVLAALASAERYRLLAKHSQDVTGSKVVMLTIGAEQGMVMTSPDQMTDERIAKLFVEYYRVVESVARGMAQEA